MRRTEHVGSQEGNGVYLERVQVNVSLSFYELIYIMDCINLFIRIYYVYTKSGGYFMQTQVKAWGNSQGIRISKDVLQEASISIDDVLDVQVTDGMITLAKLFRHKKLEERAAEYNGKLDLDGEFDWGEQIGREIWK